MKISSVILSLLFILSFLSCTKGPGSGGRASIKGKVYSRNYAYGSGIFVATDSGYIGGQKVYLKYGDQVGVGDDVETDNTGTYIFPYLRKGDYTIYVYSKRLVNNSLDSAIVRKVTIEDRKGEVEVPQIDINTLKN